jgi:peptide/nickel transport system substrate-binding protein
MNTALTVQFYGENAERIYRPISNESWASPDVTEAYYEFTRNHAKIEELVNQAGWVKNSDGILEKDGKKLELKFTIAGESKNHPAYGMFDDAAKFLNECGFVITVGTDIQALSKLATGGLQVWAAAWQTGVDPDPYQTYHKDSTATSVKNWNYDAILDPNNSDFYRERETVEAISTKIDAGRKTLDQDERKDIYAETLQLIMDLAVELPTYQRKDLISWNKDVIDESTLNLSGATSTTGVLYKIWQVNYN